MQNEIYSKEYSTVNNAVIQLGDIDDSGKGRHFKSRFIQPGVAGYPGQFGNVLITKESLDKFIDTMVGVPVIVNHKSLNNNNVDDERVGVVNSVWYDDKDGWYWCDGIIWDSKAQKLITDKGWSVSCSYDVKTADDKGGTENNIKYDMEFLDGVFTHLALVNNPRYERANIVLNSKDTLTEQFTDIFFEALAEVIVENGLGESVENDKWITIKGNHILLKDGETLADAFKRHTGASLGKGNQWSPKSIHTPSKAYSKILESVKESNARNITPNEIIENAVKSLNYSAEEIRQKIAEADLYNEGIKDKGLETYLKYSDGNGVYKRERAEKHKEIIKELFKNADSARPKNGEKPKFLVLGGRGGSGKSKFDGLVYDRSKYIVLDADAIKEMLPEYRGNNAFEVHEESSDILKQALKKAQKKGLNVVLDGTMKTLSSTEKKIKDFADKGYDIEMYYMHLPREKSAERAIGRFMGDNGRYVPLNVLLDMKHNEENFDALKKYASKWAFYNNDVPRKEDKPILVDKNY